MKAVVSREKKSPLSRKGPASFVLAIASALLGLALLAAPLGAGPEEEETAAPHAFMKDPERCVSCHASKPEPGKDDYTTVTFVDQIVTLCSDCHPDAHYRDEHPVEIRPELEVPQEFHLDEYYTMTCATCHDPHGPHLSEQRLAQILQQRGLAHFTERTIVNPGRLREELEHIRQLGYALDDEEHAIGLRCVAAPIFDENRQALAAISLSGPKARMTDARLDELGVAIRQTADEITQALGGHKPG